MNKVELDERKRKNGHLREALACFVAAPIFLLVGLLADMKGGADTALTVIPSSFSFVICVGLFFANLARAYKVLVEPNEYGEA